MYNTFHKMVDPLLQAPREFFSSAVISRMDSIIAGMFAHSSMIMPYGAKHFPINAKAKGYSNGNHNPPTGVDLPMSLTCHQHTSGSDDISSNPVSTNMKLSKAPPQINGAGPTITEQEHRPGRQSEPTSKDGEVPASLSNLQHVAEIQSSRDEARDRIWRHHHLTQFPGHMGEFTCLLPLHRVGDTTGVSSNSKCPRGGGYLGRPSLHVCASALQQRVRLFLKKQVSTHTHTHTCISELFISSVLNRLWL